MFQQCTVILFMSIFIEQLEADVLPQTHSLHESSLVWGFNRQLPLNLFASVNKDVFCLEITL